MVPLLAVVIVGLVPILPAWWGLCLCLCVCVNEDRQSKVQDYSWVVQVTMSVGGDHSRSHPLILLIDGIRYHGIVVMGGSLLVAVVYSDIISLLPFFIHLHHQYRRHNVVLHPRCFASSLIPLWLFFPLVRFCMRGYCPCICAVATVYRIIQSFVIIIHYHRVSVAYFLEKQQRPRRCCMS